MLNEPPITIQDSQPRVCPNCGGKVSSRAKTCLMCGADLEIAPAPLVAPAPPAAPGRPRVTLRNVLIQVSLTIVGLALLGGIVWGFSAAVRRARSSPPTVTPTLAHTPTSPPTTRPSDTPAPVVTPAAQSTPLPFRRHTVESGDTLSGIAQQYGTTVEDIQSLNDLGNSEILQIGQILLIPAAGATAIPPTSPPPGPTPGTVIHVVQSGETLLGIAQRYGVSMLVIQQMNNITDPETLQVGQQLYIPVGPTATATIGPPPTQTPLAKYSPPPLLSPLDREEFRGDEVQALLQWAATALLRSNEWYLVTLEVVGSSQPPATFKTKSTSLRVPLELYPSAQEKQRLFKWRVDIVRQLDAPPDGSEPTYQDASLPGESRSFWWVQPPPTPTPTLAPS